MNTQRNETSSAAKLPILTAYHVRDKNGSETIWVRVSTTELNSDDTDFDIQIETIPLEGSVSLRISSRRPE